MASRLFDKKTVIGMIHCLPLPGAANYGGSMQAVIDRALADLHALEKAGVDAAIVENFCDKPATTLLQPEQLAALSAISALVKAESTISIGIDAAFCDPKASLAIAVAVGADFIRVPVFVDTVVTSDGIVNPCAAELLRMRKLLDAENIALLCDVQTKHTFMLTDSISIEESAVMAADAGADAIIVTGAHTGASTPVEAIKRVKAVTDLPVVAGSGVKISNVTEQFSLVDAAIIGSAMKPNGKAEEPISYELAKQLMDKVREFRGD